MEATRGGVAEIEPGAMTESIDPTLQFRSISTDRFRQMILPSRAAG